MKRRGKRRRAKSHLTATWRADSAASQRGSITSLQIGPISCTVPRRPADRWLIQLRGGLKMINCIGWYLVGKPRAVLKYERQSRKSQCQGFSDSDWAGCGKSGKSISGGVIVIGTHFLKCWSRTQQSITLSSAETELLAMCNLSAELSGVRSMLKDLGEVRTGS